MRTTLACDERQNRDALLDRTKKVTEEAEVWFTANKLRLNTNKNILNFHSTRKAINKIKIWVLPDYN